MSEAIDLFFYSYRHVGLLAYSRMITFLYTFEYNKVYSLLFSLSNDT